MSRFIEFSVLFAAAIAGAVLYFSPQTNPRWRPALKYFMFALVLAFTLSEFILKDFTGKGWEDRAAHLVGYAVCAVIPQFSRCFDRTIADLNEAIRENPRNPAVLVDRGNAFFGHGDFDRAVEDFNEALHLNPELAAAYARRAYAYRAKGEHDRAVADIEKASKLDPLFAPAISDFVRAFAMLALKEEKQNNKELARALELEEARAVAINKEIERRDEIAALLARARTYLITGDLAAARLVLRTAAGRDDPQAALALGGTYDPIVLNRLGIVNFHADPAQAREWYRRAAQLGSSDASLRLEQLIQTEAKNEPPPPVGDLRKTNARKP